MKTKKRKLPECFYKRAKDVWAEWLKTEDSLYRDFEEWCDERVL